LVALARLDSGALHSLSGQRLDATLYLVGNPVVARDVTALKPAAALNAPFRIAIYQDMSGKSRTLTAAGGRVCRNDARAHRLRESGDSRP
jgi:Domain of unknown function DUF302